MADAITQVGDVQGFFHVRVVIGLVTGLSVTRLLNGLARFVQHPSRALIYPPHLAWTFFLLIFVTHFWWFEFGLSVIGRWEYSEYVFVTTYAALIFFVSTLLFPDKMEDYSGFAEYFHSRQQWFYGLLAVLFLIDLIDSAIKGSGHLLSLGRFYPVRQFGLAGLSVCAMFIRNPRVHLAFACLAILAEIAWIAARFDVLSHP